MQIDITINVAAGGCGFVSLLTMLLQVDMNQITTNYVAAGGYGFTDLLYITSNYVAAGGCGLVSLLTMLLQVDVDWYHL